MYIKFCRSYGDDKKDEADENLQPKLSVELEGKKGKEPTEGNVRLYRAVCLFLTLICIVLLVVVIILSLKQQTGSTVCPVIEETTTTAPTTAPACTLKLCQNRFPAIYIKHHGCQKCANGWLTFGQSCFFLSTFRLNWHQSQQNCTSRGGSLAVVTSKNIQDFLTLKGNLQYWIGMSQKDTEWTWVNNTKLQESYWAEYPRTGNCGILDSTGPAAKNWVRGSCNSATYFICQMQL